MIFRTEETNHPPKDLHCLRNGIAILLVSLAFSGCTQSSSAQINSNLTATALEIDTANPRVGFPLVLTATIEATEITSDVSVSYYALNGDDVAAELEQVRQFYLGTATFDSVDPAVLEYQAEITVPAAVSPPGSYVIMCSIDPSELIAESDEDDNLSEVAVHLEPFQDPNVYLEDFAIDSTSIFLDADQDDVEGDVGDVQNSDNGATLALAVEGTLNPVEVEGFATLVITRSDLPLGMNSHEIPLYLWDSVGQRYVDTYGLFGPVEWLPLGVLEPQLAAETDTDIDFTALDRKSVHLDVYLPGGLAEVMITILDNLPQGPLPPVPPDLTSDALLELKDFFQGATAGVTSYAIVADIRAADDQLGDEFLGDNSAAETIYIILPGDESYSPDRPLAFEAGLDANWENDRFGVGFEFDSFAFVDGRGALGEVHGSVPAKIFGHGFDFMWFDVRAQVVPAIDPAAIPEGENSGFALALEFATSTVYSYEEDLGYLYDGTFSVTKEKSIEKQFFIGPVPVNATGGITGEIGYQLTANLQPTSLASQAGPFARLDAYLEASVGVSGFQAGPGGNMTLVDERFVGTVTTGLDVSSYGPGDARFTGSTNMRVSNIVSGPSGRLYLFVEYPGVKWCRRCAFGHCVSYPCGIKTMRKEYGLVSWQTFVKEDILFEETLCKGVLINGDDVSFFVCTP